MKSRHADDCPTPVSEPNARYRTIRSAIIHRKRLSGRILAKIVWAAKLLLDIVLNNRILAACEWYTLS